MAKNLNSAVSFTALLLVLLMASTEILKIEAVDCISGGCVPKKVFAEECGPAPFVGADLDCCKCCKDKYPLMETCAAAVEGKDAHCHCYGNGSEPPSSHDGHDDHSSHSPTKAPAAKAPSAATFSANPQVFGTALFAALSFLF